MISVEFEKYSTDRVKLSYPFSYKTNDIIKKISGYNFDCETKTWSIPYSQLDKLIDKIGEEEIDFDEKVLTKYKADHIPVSERLKHVKLLDEKYEFKTKPYPHQIEAFNIGIQKDNLLIADDQGLGKTMEAANIARYRKLNNGVEKCLVVCGVNSVKYNWKKELEVHTDEKSFMIDGSNTDKKLKQIENWVAGDEYFGIINVEALRKPEIVNALKDVVGMVIVDEVHKVKNGRSQQGKAIHELKPRYKIGLTGTPITSQAMDLHNILTYLDIENRSYLQFRNRYCCMGGWQGKEVVGYRNLYELNDILKKNMVRRKKEDVVDLPEKIYCTEYVELNSSEKKHYTNARAGILEKMDEILDTSNPLAALLRLRQVTSGLFEEDKNSSKLECVKDLLEETIIPNGEKVIIFSNWEQVTELYKEALSIYNPAYITGKLTPAQRQKEVDRFQTDPNCQVIIGTIGAMGTGLTLNKASNVVFLDKSWTYADTLQAEDRAHRIGSESTVNIISIVAKDTVDEFMEDHLAKNKDLFQKIVEGSVSKEDKKKLFCEALGITELEMKKIRKTTKEKSKQAESLSLKDAKKIVAEKRESVLSGQKNTMTYCNAL